MMAEPEAPISPSSPGATVPSPAGPRSSRLAWLRRDWAFTVVLALALVGLAFIGVRRFREGSVTLASGLVLGAWLRALLPERLVGLLRLRSRITDVLVMAVLGLGTAVLALAVPSGH